MDAIRVAKVDRVLYSKTGLRVEGTLHLTAHHVIFKHGLQGTPEQEIWVPYPLISTVARLPLSLHGQSPIAFRTRTFDYFTLTFTRDRDALDVFESIKELTVASSVTNLYAFFYQPSPPYTITDGWSLYSPRDEFGRMGVGQKTRAWRFTDLNKDYTLCPTYPARLVVPAKISDSTLTYGARYRTKGRIPALVYLHWNNQASITRSSQPTVGLTNSRSIQDEKLVEAVFQSHHLAASPYASIPAPRSTSVYGATATNIIIDARSATSGVANVARGGGTENMDYYKEGRKVHLGIENIHVMRDSLAKVADALRDADAMIPSPEGATGILDRQALRRSGWLKHISALLDGALIIIKNIHVNSSHVLIHCSDGWDRTAQLSTLAQLCLDPYYRTYRGFQVLIEKDWVSFGHRFLDRCGHLSSEKFFLTPSSDGSAEGAQAFFASVQNKFTSPSHLKETSPVFHQFLECVRQIQRQHPTRFEFNERYLEKLHYHLYSCQFGTFLYNCERDRRVAPDATSQPPYLRTHSVWDDLNSEPLHSQLINPDYDTSIDSHCSTADRTGDMGVLYPNPRDVKFWHELYGRADEEMNGRIIQTNVTGVDVIGPVDNAADDPAQPSTPSRTFLPLTGDIDATATQIVLTPSSGTTPRSLTPGAPSSPSVNGATTPSPSPIAPPVTSVASQIDTGTSVWASLAPSTSPAPTFRPSSPTRKGSASPGTGAAFAATAAGGMKSLWSQISSNASAAFTAVQGAYDSSAAKEFMSGNAGSASTPSREREWADTGTPRQSWGFPSMPNLDEGLGTTPAVPPFPQRAERDWTERVGRSSQQAQSLRTLRGLPAELDDPWSSHPPQRDRGREGTTTTSHKVAQNIPKFSSVSERRSPSRSSILEMPPSPNLTRSISASPLTSPVRQLSSVSLGEPPMRETTAVGEQPHVSIISPIPLPSQNPYITASRSPSPNPPAALVRANALGTPSFTGLSLDERDPSSRPSRSPSLVGASGIAEPMPLPPAEPPQGGREVDPLGVGFLG